MTSVLTRTLCSASRSAARATAEELVQVGVSITCSLTSDLSLRSWRTVSGCNVTLPEAASSSVSIAEMIAGGSTASVPSGTRGTVRNMVFEDNNDGYRSGAGPVLVATGSAYEFWDPDYIHRDVVVRHVDKSDYGGDAADIIEIIDAQTGDRKSVV